MENRKKDVPIIAWLKVTDYLLEWLQNELGASTMVREKKVVCVQHLEGIKKIMKMESKDDTQIPEKIKLSASDMRFNCVAYAVKIDPVSAKEMYGITEDDLELFLPIECSPTRITETGLLRPWKLNAAFGHQQAAALLKLLRDEFWKAVAAFDREYAREKNGKHYPAKEMIEAFCTATHTSDLYVDALRREWQRRAKRSAS